MIRMKKLSHGDDRFGGNILLLETPDLWSVTYAMTYRGRNTKTVVSVGSFTETTPEFPKHWIDAITAQLPVLAEWGVEKERQEFHKDWKPDGAEVKTRIGYYLTEWAGAVNAEQIKADDWVPVFD